MPAPVIVIAGAKALMAAGVLGGTMGFLAGSGGQENVVETSHKTTTNSVLNSLREITNELTNSVEQRMTGVQKIDLEMGNITLTDGASCSITAEQTMNLKAHSRLTAITELNNEQIATLTEKISNEQESMIEQMNENMSIFSQSNESTTHKEIYNHLEANMTDLVRNSINNTQLTQIDGTQEIKWKMEDVYLSGEGTNCDFTLTQNMALEMVSEQLSDSIVSSLQSLEIYRDVTNTQRDEISQTNSGIDPFASLGSVASSCVPCLLALFVGGIFPLLSGGGEEDFQEWDDGFSEEIYSDDMYYGGGKKKKPKKKVGGGKSGKSEKSPLNWPILIICLLSGILILFMVLTYEDQKPQASGACPSEETCSKNWDKIVDLPLSKRKLVMIENCRLEHHFWKNTGTHTDENGNKVTHSVGDINVQGEKVKDKKGRWKPKYFGPYCETNCSWTLRRKDEGKPHPEWMVNYCEKELEREAQN